MMDAIGRNRQLHRIQPQLKSTIIKKNIRLHKLFNLYFSVLGDPRIEDEKFKNTNRRVLVFSKIISITRNACTTKVKVSRITCYERLKIYS